MQHFRLPEHRRINIGKYVIHYFKRMQTTYVNCITDYTFFKKEEASQMVARTPRGILFGRLRFHDERPIRGLRQQ